MSCKCLPMTCKSLQGLASSKVMQSLPMACKGLAMLGRVQGVACIPMTFWAFQVAQCLVSAGWVWWSAWEGLAISCKALQVGWPCKLCKLCKAFGSCNILHRFHCDSSRPCWAMQFARCSTCLPMNCKALQGLAGSKVFQGLPVTHKAL